LYLKYFPKRGKDIWNIGLLEMEGTLNIKNVIRNKIIKGKRDLFPITCGLLMTNKTKQKTTTTTTTTNCKRI